MIELVTTYLVCPGCHERATPRSSCTLRTIEVIGHGVWDRVVNTHEVCSDCSVRAGGLHHVACNQEPCPICSLMLVDCAHTPQLFREWREELDER